LAQGRPPTTRLAPGAPSLPHRLPGHPRVPDSAGTGTCGAMGDGESKGTAPSQEPAARPQGRCASVAVAVETTVGPGGGSAVLSEPLERLLPSAERAWAAFEHLQRSRGYAPPHASVKDFSTVDLGGGAFLSQYTVEPGAEAGGRASGSGAVVLLHEPDPGRLEWVTRRYRSSPPTEDGLEFTLYLKFHREPMHVEAWSTRRGMAARPTGQELESALQEMLGAVFKLAKVEPRSVACDVRKWSVLSEPLDDILSPEAFWRAFLARARRGAERAREAGAALSQVKGGFALERDGAHQSSYLDKKKDEWTCAEHGSDASRRCLEGLTVTKVHRGPFRLELRSEQPTLRLAGPELQAHMQDVLGDVAAMAAAGTVPARSVPQEPLGGA